MTMTGEFVCHLCGHSHDKRDELLALPNVCGFCNEHAPKPHCARCGRGISEVLTQGSDESDDIVCMICVAESIGL